MVVIQTFRHPDIQHPTSTVHGSARMTDFPVRLLPCRSVLPPLQTDGSLLPSRLPHSAGHDPPLPASAPSKENSFLPNGQIAALHCRRMPARPLCRLYCMCSVHVCFVDGRATFGGRTTCMPCHGDQYYQVSARTEVPKLGPPIPPAGHPIRGLCRYAALNRGELRRQQSHYSPAVSRAPCRPPCVCSCHVAQRRHLHVR